MGPTRSRSKYISDQIVDVKYKSRSCQAIRISHESFTSLSVVIHIILQHVSLLLPLLFLLNSTSCL